MTETHITCDDCGGDYTENVEEGSLFIGDCCPACPGFLIKRDGPWVDDSVSDDTLGQSEW